MIFSSDNRLARKKNLIIVSLFALLSACASTPTQQIEVDAIQFKGDNQPSVSSADLVLKNYANLTEGETVVVAIAADKTGAISVPNPVNATVVETVAENETASLEHMRSRCDVDSDGIWDRYCPELLSQLVSSGSEKVVMFETVSTISPVTSDRDNWGTLTSFDRNDVAGRTQPIYVRLLTVNRGNKVFAGNLNLLVNLPPQVEFKEVKDLYKVKSNAKTKEAVGTLIAIAAMASGNPYAYATASGDVPFIKNFHRERSYSNFSTNRNGKNLSVTANNVSIEPNQGVELIYEVSYRYED